MLVLLHGRHGNEDVPWIFARNIPDNWLIIAPRAIEFEPESAEHEIGYSWMEMPESGWPTFDAFDGAVQALSDFIVAMHDVYKTDPQNVVILGFSQGAATALATAITHRNICKAIACLVGFVPDADEQTLETHPLQRVPVFMAAGDRDERIPLEISERSAKTVKSAGADLTRNVYQVGHKLNSQGMRDLSSWLKNQMA